MSCVYCTFGIKGVSITNINDTPFIRTGRTQDNTRVKMKAGKISLEKKKFLKEDKISLCSDLVINSLQVLITGRPVDPTSSLPCGTASLRTPPVVLNLVNSPNSPLHILHSHKAFMEAEVVSHCIL